MQYHTQHSNRKQWLVALLVIGCLGLAACNQPVSSAGGEADAPPPAKVEPIAGTNLNRVILTADAAARIGVQTATVQQKQTAGTTRMVVPYSAVIYDLHGDTWVYTNPSPLTYVRAAIDVDNIDGDQTTLVNGPPVGTAIVTVGAAELFGAELGVGSCGVCAP
jgi:hypothetical protein